MGLFSKKQKKAKKVVYDKTGKKPVIRASICTGEQVAGFKDLKSGKFEDLMVLHSDEDLKQFLDMYDVKADEITKEY